MKGRTGPSSRNAAIPESQLPVDDHITPVWLEPFPAVPRLFILACTGQTGNTKGPQLFTAHQTQPVCFSFK